MTRTLLCQKLFLLPAFLILAGGSFARAGGIPFSGPTTLATLPWTNAAGPGAPISGADWLVADPKIGILLVSGLDFDLFSRSGRWEKTFQPLDPKDNFYGFCAAAVQGDGDLVFLERLESAQEQWGKDNFEMRSKPGVRRVVLDPKGQVLSKTEWTDPTQPHSNYWLLEGGLFAIHDDGTYDVQGTAKTGKPGSFSLFAQLASTPDHWTAHLRSLPIFHSKDRAYHDIQGKPHEVKEAESYLLGRRYVEGVGPLALRRGRIYYQVVCDTKEGFRNSVFVEDPVHKGFALVELVPSTEDLEGTRKPALYVDVKGDIFEGVAAKEGYRIFEWRIKN